MLDVVSQVPLTVKPVRPAGGLPARPPARLPGRCGKPFSLMSRLGGRAVLCCAVLCRKRYQRERAQFIKTKRKSAQQAVQQEQAEQEQQEEQLG
jgi:hypothetical protein